MVKSAYIHIPFCKQICSYCDFCKVIYNKKWIDDYLDSLEYEIETEYKNETLNTIYIGGGTPSSLDINELKRLFSIVNIFNLNNTSEFTIECNIEDITEEKLILFKQNRVNRISIGVESFNDKYLKYLNRSYKSDIIEDKINLAKKYFDNINIDLIYAIKNQTLEELEEDLDKIINLDVTHVSCYSLIIEENTKLYIDNTKEIDDELDYKMYKLIDDKFKNIYKRYEISNYCKDGYESKNNLTYWNNEKYYGFGLSSSGYIDDYRYTNTKNLNKYLNKNYDRKIEKISKNDKIKYELILGFRKVNGINKIEFYDKYNKDILNIKNIKELIDKKYLIDENNYIKVNPKYLYVINDILVKLI